MLATGQQLGHYRILSSLGAGGMGEVYLADDTRLGRKVAIKVLPHAVATDEQSRRRLIREARAAATLDHPNICTVYEIGEVDGRHFIAMQYVQGQTLAARLKHGPLDLRSALTIATQMAAALAEAHSHDLVHRDVKPQNIMLTPDNQVKVLDFGLAKVTAPVGHDAHTVSFITEAGAVAGTVPYMSPEQIRGEPLDARSDVFAMGCVMYEMFGRINPFLRDHAADTMSAILTLDPPPLPQPAVPAELQRIVRKCLEKDRQRRYQTMRDLAIDLESAASDLVSGSTRPGSDGSMRTASWRSRWVAVPVTAALVLAGAAAAYLYFRAGTPVQLSPDSFVQITALPDTAAAPAISPDGRMIAFLRGDEFLGTGQVYVKLLPAGDPVQLTNDPRPKYAPTFTPDGSRVAYTAIDANTASGSSGSWDTWTVPVLGGQPARLLTNAAGLTWIDEHHVLFSEIEPGTGLHMGIVTASEDRQGQRRIYFPAEMRAMAHYSYLSPDRRWVLVVEMGRTATTFAPCRLVPFDGSSSGRLVGPQGSCTSAAWSPDGRWMYFIADVNGRAHVWRQRFPDGAPAQVTSGSTTEERGLAMAPDGRSLITSIGQSVSSLWMHDSRGERLVPLDGSVGAPRMSRDGTRVYCFVQRVGEPSAVGLAVVDLASGKADRMLNEFTILDFDISRDEQSAAFTAVDNRGSRQIWIAALDRRSPPQQIASNGDGVHFGRRGELVYRSLTGTTNALVRISTDGRDATRIFDRSVIELGDVSPDGEWAIVATPTPGDPSGAGTFAVPVHQGSPKQLCTGPCPVRWSPDGGSVYVAVSDVAESGRLVRYVLRPGQMLPDLSATGADVPLHGYPASRWNAMAPGPDPSTYVFTKAEQRGNLFRVPLR